MGKRGQIALFVIIAILMISAAFIILYTQTDIFGKRTEKLPEIAPIQAFIENCIRETGQDALVFIGQQGGYYEPPKFSISGYSYYFYDNKSVMPSKENIEIELSKYMNEMLPFCTQNFVDFPDFSIEADPDITSKAVILADKVRFDVNYKVLIKKGDSIFRISSFSNEIPSRLYRIYNVTSEIIAKQLTDPSRICLSCLTKWGIENDLYIDLANFGNDTVIFTITDKKIPINNNYYQFIFANKYG